MTLELISPALLLSLLPPQPDQIAPPATIAIRAKKVVIARNLVLAV
ncbi:MAG TPA: hypothetical protein VMR96_04050 [Solirubrobacterales bacterium]|nr:hypothetical protein [Solirubrobacterales bacterium]